MDNENSTEWDYTLSQPYPNQANQVKACQFASNFKKKTARVLEHTIDLEGSFLIRIARKFRALWVLQKKNPHTKKGPKNSPKYYPESMHHDHLPLHNPDRMHHRVPH
jgi:hypothetical protein